MDSVLYEWRTFEYEHKHRPTDWYWAVGIVTAALVIVALIWGDAMFAFLLALGGTTLLIHAHRAPKEIVCIIETQGIHAGELFLSWDDIIKFDIHEEDTESLLVLETKKMAHRIITLSLPADAPLPEIEQLIRLHAPKGVVRFTLGDVIMDRLGF